MISIRINGAAYNVPQDTTILEACRKFGIYIPTICYHSDLVPQGICGMCLVKVDGQAYCYSCITKVHSNMEVVTDSPDIITKLKDRFSNFIDTSRIPKSDDIEDIIDYLYSKKPLRIRKYEKTSSLVFDPSKCINCNRCVSFCSDIMDVDAFSDPNVKISNTDCVSCGLCAQICPTKALSENSSVSFVLRNLIQSDTKICVLIIDPTALVSVGEVFGDQIGSNSTKKLINCAQIMGFKYVYNAACATDVSLNEHADELIKRIREKNQKNEENKKCEKIVKYEKLPLFNSNCPSFINFLEKLHPQLLNNVKPIKTPYLMLAKMIRNNPIFKAKNIFIVCLSACVPMKSEIKRMQYTKDVDAVVSVKEFSKMIKSFGIEWSTLNSTSCNVSVDNSLIKVSSNVSFFDSSNSSANNNINNTSNNSNNINNNNMNRKQPNNNINLTFNEPYSSSSPASILCSIPGGFTEGVLSNVKHLLNTKERVSTRIINDEVNGNKGDIFLNKPSIISKTFQIEDLTIKVAICNGLRAASDAINNLQNNHYDFIEVCTCPGGCLCGGGMPKLKNRGMALPRIESIEILAKSFSLTSFGTMSKHSSITNANALTNNNNANTNSNANVYNSSLNPVLANNKKIILAPISGIANNSNNNINNNINATSSSSNNNNTSSPIGNVVSNNNNKNNNINSIAYRSMRNSQQQLLTSNPSNKIVDMSLKPEYMITHYEPQETAIKKRSTTILPIVAYGSLAGKSCRYARLIASFMKCQSVSMNHIDNLSQRKVIVFVVSTVADGKFPMNSRTFIDSLKSSSPPSSEYLKNLTFAVLALGSKAYADTFCEAGKMLFEMLETRNAKPIIPLMFVDDSLEDKGESTFEEFCKQLSGALFLDRPRIGVELISNVVESDDKSVVDKPSRPNGFEIAEMVERELLSPEGEKPAMHRYLLKLPDGMSYETGDHVLVLPRNDKEIVDRIMSLLKYDKDKVFVFQYDEIIPRKTSVYQLFTQYLDLNGKLTRGLVRTFFDAANNEDGKKKLMPLLDEVDTSSFDELANDINIAEFIEQSVQYGIPPLDRMVSAVPHIVPRIYSVASAPDLNRGYVELVVLDVHFGPNLKRYGITTHFLSRPNLVQVPIHCMKGIFQYPKENDTPILMVAVGGGISPMFSLIQHRMTSKEKLGDAYLFFQSHHSSAYPLLNRKLTNFVKTNIIQELFVTYTLDTKEKVEVQDIMKKNMTKIWEIWQNPKTKLFYCGPPRKVFEEVKQILLDVTSREGYLSIEEAMAVNSRHELIQASYEM